MKKLFYSIIFAFVTVITVSSCTEQNITPKDGPETGGGSGDQCQFGGPGCPKKP